MSELRKPDADAVLAVSPDTVKQLAERPLLAVPHELRVPVFQAWALYRHLTGMETPAPIAFAVGLWVSEHKHTPDAIRRALRELTDPAVMRTIRYASDLTATLAELVSPPPPPESNHDKAKRLRAEMEAARAANQENP